jgi:membrane fusion protein (multidrug efflux system)
MSTDMTMDGIDQLPRLARQDHHKAPTSEARRDFIRPEAEARQDELPRSPQPDGNAPKPARKRSARRIVLPVIALAALIGGGWYGYGYWTEGRYMVSTDDAYVEGDISQIAPKVTGYVAAVNVVANQTVKAGDPLVTLDDGDYQIAVRQAQAAIDTQGLTLQRIDDQIAGAAAGVKQAEAQKTALAATQHNAQLKRDRAAQLNARTFGSQADLDAANAALDEANANLAGADAAIASAQANVSVLEGQKAEAASSLKTLQLALDKAQRDLGFTVIRAPYDGVVGNVAVQKGDFVTTGLRLMALVPTRALYVDANFKETQLPGLVPGESVAIHVDALGGKTLTGTVQSVAPASGSVFSLLPAQNATGNFTKVVQRLPVRIALPQAALDSGALRAGLSVVVEADTRTIPADGTEVAAK